MDITNAIAADKREFIKISQAVGVGFLVMGVIGYVVKLSMSLWKSIDDVAFSGAGCDRDIGCRVWRFEDIADLLQYISRSTTSWLEEHEEDELIVVEYSKRWCGTMIGGFEQLVVRVYDISPLSLRKGYGRVFI